MRLPRHARLLLLVILHLIAAHLLGASGARAETGPATHRGAASAEQEFPLAPGQGIVIQEQGLRGSEQYRIFPSEDAKWGFELAVWSHRFLLDRATIDPLRVHRITHALARLESAAHGRRIPASCLARIQIVDPKREESSQVVREFCVPESPAAKQIHSNLIFDFNLLFMTGDGL